MSGPVLIPWVPSPTGKPRRQRPHLPPAHAEENVAFGGERGQRHLVCRQSAGWQGGEQKGSENQKKTPAPRGERRAPLRSNHTIRS